MARDKVRLVTKEEYRKHKSLCNKYETVWRKKQKAVKKRTKATFVKLLKEEASKEAQN